MALKKLRILQVLRAPTGGLWRHVVDLSQNLSELGHDVGIVLDSDFADPQTEAGLALLEENLSLGVHRLSISRRPGPKDVFTSLKLRNLSKRLQVDVVHGHGAKGGLFARLVGIRSPRRIAVYTPHGGVLNFDPETTAGRVFRGIEKCLLPFTNAILFESEYARQTFTRQIATPKCSTPIIHNGLKPSEFSAMPASADAFDFLFVGELRDLKGIPFLLEALVLINKQNSPPSKLLLVGGGPDKAFLENRIVELGLSDHVQMAGVQPAHAMFAKGRCVVVPSLSESLPYIVLEAAAAEKPIIATRVGGIHEIFGPTADKLVPPADAKSLANAMQAYLDAPDITDAEMRERLAFVKERFSLNLMTTDILRSYNDALIKQI